MLVPAVEALKVGDPLDETTDVATLINEGEVDARRGRGSRRRVEQGATLATGGVATTAACCRPCSPTSRAR